MQFDPATSAHGLTRGALHLTLGVELDGDGEGADAAMSKRARSAPSGRAGRGAGGGLGVAPDLLTRLAGLSDPYGLRQPVCRPDGERLETRGAWAQSTRAWPVGA